MQQCVSSVAYVWSSPVLQEGAQLARQLTCALDVLGMTMQNMVRVKHRLQQHISLWPCGSHYRLLLGLPPRQPIAEKGHLSACSSLRSWKHGTCAT